MKLLGTLLLLLGAGLSFGALNMVGGVDGYFLAAGIGIAVTGILLAANRRSSIICYALTLGFVIVASVYEFGADPSALLPRLGMPVIIGAYLFSPQVRRQLG